MVRRQAVSDWLENVVAEKVRGELVQDTNTAGNVFSLLTGHCVLQACNQANNIGKYASLEHWYFGYSKQLICNCHYCFVFGNFEFLLFWYTVNNKLLGIGNKAKKVHALVVFQLLSIK